MRYVLRLIRIVFTFLRFGIDDLALSGFRQRRVRVLARVITLGRNFDATPRGVRLRLALEHLGPIFIKFGQVLVHGLAVVSTSLSWRRVAVPYSGVVKGSAAAAAARLE